MDQDITPGYYWVRWAHDDGTNPPFIADVVEVEIGERPAFYEAYRAGDDVPFPMYSIVILSGPLEEPKQNE